MTNHTPNPSVGAKRRTVTLNPAPKTPAEPEPAAIPARSPEAIARAERKLASRAAPLNCWYLVLNTTTGKCGKFRHPTYEQAQIEADRLGTQQPDHAYVVYKCTPETPERVS